MDYPSIAKDAGPMVAILCVILSTFAFAVWWVARWAAANIVAPAVKSHTDLVDSLKASTIKHGEMLGSLVGSNAAASEKLSKLVELATTHNTQEVAWMQDQGRRADVGSERMRELLELARKRGTA